MHIPHQNLKLQPDNKFTSIVCDSLKLCWLRRPCMERRGRIMPLNLEIWCNRRKWLFLWKPHSDVTLLPEILKFTSILCDSLKPCYRVTKKTFPCMLKRRGHNYAINPEIWYNSKRWLFLQIPHHNLKLLPDIISSHPYKPVFWKLVA